MHSRWRGCERLCRRNVREMILWSAGFKLSSGGGKEGSASVSCRSEGGGAWERALEVRLEQERHRCLEKRTHVCLEQERHWCLDKCTRVHQFS